MAPAVLDDLLTPRRGFFPLASGRFSRLEVAVAVPKYATQIFQKIEKIQRLFQFERITYYYLITISPDCLQICQLYRAKFLQHVTS